MSKAKHVNIPVFMPEWACPQRCVFCNQHAISNAGVGLDITAIARHIDTHLATIAPDAVVEIAFFGGNFTGVAVEVQKALLDTATAFVEQGRVMGIRFSTRPDYISEQVMDFLSSYPVTAIELGAQTTDKEVLRQSGRGHTVDDVWRASACVKDRGIELGLQMMIGLPGDSQAKSLQTACDIVAMQAATSRIYPTLVLSGTELEELFLRNEYEPLTLEDAVETAAQVYGCLTRGGVKVIKTGLHPNDDFNHRVSLVAGPYHRAFGEMVKSRFWYHSLSGSLNQLTASRLELVVPTHQYNHVVGYHRVNLNCLERQFGHVKITADPVLEENTFHVRHC